MNNSLDFFSIINSGDKKYSPIYNNFISHLKNVGIENRHELVEVSGESASFIEDSFPKIAFEKINLTKEKLESGKTVFCSDLDIVFLKDPIDYMLSLLNIYDIVIQRDGVRWEAARNNRPPRLCTGFYMVKPTKLTLELFNTKYDRNDHWIGKDKTDQGYLNAKFWNNAKHDGIYKDLKVKILDIDTFPNGSHWYEYSKFIKDPYIVHYNYKGTVEQKTNAMKKYNHWILQ